MDIVKVFARNIRKFRVLGGLSQEKLAEKSGLHRTYISSIERCQRNVSIENVQRLADALGLEAYQLLLDESQEETLCPPTSKNSANVSAT